MGSMKDLLGDDLPTIGDSRRQGMHTFSVHCGAPCGHVSKLTFDALRLPDETIFIDIGASAARAAGGARPRFRQAGTRSRPGETANGR